ncbi:hypothetical protein [Solwaraspora sp. WMMD792]|nr:hypothetical protein [Solwaraspora sp. WMMD792]MDG4770025.1 hypothetical protein [Solwaraspora sp. WMMD792]
MTAESIGIAPLRSAADQSTCGLPAGRCAAGRRIRPTGVIDRRPG